jgi:hypothetical protein
MVKNERREKYMIMRLFEKSSLEEEISNEQSTLSFQFESESKSNGYFVEFEKINAEEICMVFITYSETGKEITHSSLVEKIPSEALNNVAKAASNGYDLFIHTLKNLHTGNDRVQDFIKWGVWDVERAFMKQQSGISLGLK